MYDFSHRSIYFLVWLTAMSCISHCHCCVGVLQTPWFALLCPSLLGFCLQWDWGIFHLACSSNDVCYERKGLIREKEGGNLEGEKQWKKHEGKATQAERRDWKMLIWHLMLLRDSWPCLLNRSLCAPFLAGAAQQRRLMLQRVNRISYPPKKQMLENCVWLHFTHCYFSWFFVFHLTFYSKPKKLQSLGKTTLLFYA